MFYAFPEFAFGSLSLCEVGTKLGKDRLMFGYQRPRFGDDFGRVRWNCRHG